MSMAKVKIFRRSDPAKLEIEVNEWLASLAPGAVVQRSETAVTMKNDATVIVMTVWYTDAGH